MAVSSQAVGAELRPETGPRVRMKRTLLEAAMRLLQNGLVPSVSDVAVEAEVSRATAYRYFPTQTALIQEAVDEALGPILGWECETDVAAERVAELIAFSYPRMDQYEATHRGALLVAMVQWSRRKAGALGEESPVVRGNRKELLAKALAPLRPVLPPEEFDRLRQGLSLIFGIEAIVVLKDIWELDSNGAQDVALWAARTLVQGAISEANGDLDYLVKER